MLQMRNHLKHFFFVCILKANLIQDVEYGKGLFAATCGS